MSMGTFERRLLADYRWQIAKLDDTGRYRIANLGFERVGNMLGADHFKGSVSDEHRYELHVENRHS